MKKAAIAALHRGFNFSLDYFVSVWYHHNIFNAESEVE